MTEILPMDYFVIDRRHFSIELRIVLFILITDYGSIFRIFWGVGGMIHDCFIIYHNIIINLQTYLYIS